VNGQESGRQAPGSRPVTGALLGLDCKIDTTSADDSTGLMGYSTNISRSHDVKPEFGHHRVKLAPGLSSSGVDHVTLARACSRVHGGKAIEITGACEMSRMDHEHGPVLDAIAPYHERGHTPYSPPGHK